jgi:hypothetical protein
MDSEDFNDIYRALNPGAKEMPADKRNREWDAKAKEDAAAALAENPEILADVLRLLGGVDDGNEDSVRLYKGKKLNLQGYAVPEDDTRAETDLRRQRYNPFQLGVAPGTVNIVGEHHLNPRTISHELRHLQAPQYGESVNRIADGAVAEKDPEWEGAARMWGGYKNKLPSEALPDFFHQLDKGRYPAKHEYRRLHGRGAGAGATEDEYADKRRADSRWLKESKAYDEYEEWNAGIEKRNKKRAKALRGAD